MLKFKLKQYYLLDEWCWTSYLYLSFGQLFVAMTKWENQVTRERIILFHGCNPLFWTCDKGQYHGARAQWKKDALIT